MGANLPAGAGSLGFIRRCRDLVELYYGARMVMSVFESSPSTSTTAAIQVIGLDPRRIKYEIVIANPDAATQWVQIGVTPESALAVGELYQILPGGSAVIQRDFLTDGDAVCLAQFAIASDVSLNIAARETFLTPPPVDETP